MYIYISDSLITHVRYGNVVTFEHVCAHSESNRVFSHVGEKKFISTCKLRTLSHIQRYKMILHSRTNNKETRSRLYNRWCSFRMKYAERMAGLSRDDTKRIETEWYTVYCSGLQKGKDEVSECTDGLWGRPNGLNVFLALREESRLSNNTQPPRSRVSTYQYTFSRPTHLAGVYARAHVHLPVNTLSIGPLMGVEAVGSTAKKLDPLILCARFQWSCFSLSLP